MMHLASCLTLTGRPCPFLFWTKQLVLVPRFSWTVAKWTHHK